MIGLNTYLQLLLIAAIVAFIVDVSGITQTFLGILSRITGKRVVSFKPFTCSLCMTFWCCLIWCIVLEDFCIATVAASCGYALAAPLLGELMQGIRDRILLWIRKI